MEIDDRQHGGHSGELHERIEQIGDFGLASGGPTGRPREDRRLLPGERLMSRDEIASLHAAALEPPPSGIAATARARHDWLGVMDGRPRPGTGQLTYASAREIQQGVQRVVGEHLSAGGCFTGADGGRPESPCFVCRFVAHAVAPSSSRPASDG